ncbi:MAG: hypothetical protein RIS86_1982 [Planctomycetota bacterium]|jgi:uncharacterized protein (DUF58 family)
MISPELRRKIRHIEIRTSRIVSDVLAGQYRSAFKGRGMEFEEVRPYLVGDDVRTIDWNVSARAGEPHVKVFREERELTVILAADLSGSLAFGTRAELKRELAAEIAATIAFSAVRSNDRVGMLLFTDRIESFVPPAKGGRHALRIVRDLLAFEPAGRGTALAAALDELAASLPRRSVVCLVSDFLQPAGAPAWDGALARLRRRHDVVPIVVEDAFERVLPDVGVVELEDLESGRSVRFDSGSTGVREGWSMVAEERAADRLRAFRRARLEPLVLETGSDFGAPLRAYFERRGQRRRR